MADFSTLLIAALVILVVWLLLNATRDTEWVNRPPGPTGLPVIGNLHQFGSGGDPLAVVQKWKESYGEVVGLHLGHYRVIILSGYDTIKEAYGMWDFAGRQLLLPFHAIGDGEKIGLLLSEGPAWTEQRRFALRNLRDFGFGKKSMESIIQDDITELMDNFKETEGDAFVPHRKFSTAVLKSLWNIITGERFTYGDPRFQSVLDGISSALSTTGLAGPLLFLPWIARSFPGMTGWTHFQNVVGKAKNLIGGYVQEHQKTFQKDNLRDYLDVYLKEISETKDVKSSFFKGSGEKHMLVGTLNLFAAGSETTSNTLVWALLYLIKYPHVQDLLYKEISNVVGTSSLPSLEDRDSCPYTWAVMEEVLRISSLVPLGVFHNTMNDVTFKGFFIPKDTLVMANQYGVHFDKKVWGDPEIFRPERFLIRNNNGTFAKNLKAPPIIAFSVGKRACLGEVLARNNFFLYLTSLVQKFQFTSSDTKLSDKAAPGLFRVPDEFEIILKER